MSPGLRPASGHGMPSKSRTGRRLTYRSNRRRKTIRRAHTANWADNRAGFADAPEESPTKFSGDDGPSIGPTALDAVAYGAGPGSFTGLRIACGLAQGLAVARALPVYGVSSLAAMAQESGAQRVVACIDARMREVYYAALERMPDGWREVIGPRCVAPRAVAAPPGDDWIGCGNGFAVYGNFGLKIVLSMVHPTALAVAQLPAERRAHRLFRAHGGGARSASPQPLGRRAAPAPWLWQRAPRRGDAPCALARRSERFPGGAAEQPCGAGALLPLRLLQGGG